jgi:hypothetical protein
MNTTWIRKRGSLFPDDFLHLKKKAMEIEDIINMLQEEIDSGNIGSEKEVNAFLGKMMASYNNAPRDDAEGLSPQQMYQLVGLLFEKGTIITLNPKIPDELALTSPFLRICIHMLKAIPEDKPLKLTATGALPRWLVQEIYNTRVFPTHYIEMGFQSLLKERDWFLVHIARLTCELAGLARQGKGKEKEKGNWILTRKGKKLLTRPGEMLEILFTAYTDKFAWSYLDRYPSDTAAQVGFGFTLLLLHKYGNKMRDVDFYARKFLTAFPMAIDGFGHPWYADPEDDFNSCYSYRTFDRCLHPFGLVGIKTSGKKYTSTYKEKTATTPLFDAFIVVDEEKLTSQPDDVGLMPPMNEPVGEEGDPTLSKSDVANPFSVFGSSFDQPFYAEKLPGRNDPCPCGSGRKYKKCCLQ